MECQHHQVRGLVWCLTCVFQALRITKGEIGQLFKHHWWEDAPIKCGLSSGWCPPPTLSKILTQGQVGCMGKNALKSGHRPGLTSPSHLGSNRNLHATSVLEFPVPGPQNLIIHDL